MLMVRSIIRPEKSADVMEALLDAGFPAVTKVSVAGRGQQKGLKVGDIIYDELPKELLITVIPEADRELVVNTIIKSAKTAETGSYGDGKIFVSSVEETYTISSGFKEE